MDETTEPDGEQAALPCFESMAAPASGDRSMRERFAQLIALDVQFSVLAVGVDSFSRINNLFSYSFGDKVLGSLNCLIADLLPVDASVYRFDGDCFGIVLPDVTDRDTLDGLFGDILAFVNTGISIGETSISFSISGGVCIHPHNGNDADELYRNLHIALIDAKRQGRGRCTHCTHALCAISQRTLLLMETLQRCLAHGFDGFSMRYQPIMDARDERVHGCEALMRWSNDQFPEGVLPFEFIPYLEESGLICQATSWLIDVTFAQAAKWTAVDPSFIMSINLSKQVFDQPDLKFNLVQAVKKYHVNPRNIMLELTESSKVANAALLSETLDFLRGQGFLVALDDFGTGYSSLSMFRTIAADELKIDRSFLERVTYDVNDQLIISQVIELCHNMNITVCVEGIETYDVLQIVRDLGADTVQGFYYDQAIDAEVFEQRYLPGSTGAVHPDIAAEPSLVYSDAQPEQPASPGELVDRAQAGIFQAAMDETFTFITCNEGYRRMLGYTAREMAARFGNRALAIVHPDDTAYVNEEIRRQLGIGDVVLIEFRVVRWDDIPLWVTGTGNVVRPRSGKPYLVVVIVDTDRIKRASLQTARELESTHRVLENIPIGIKSVRYDDGFTFEYISPEFMATMGYTRDEIRDRFDDKYLEIIVEEDREVIVQAAQEAKPGHPLKLRFRLNASDGRKLWVETVTKLCDRDPDGMQRFVSSIAAVEGPSEQGEGEDIDNRFQLASKRWGDVLFTYDLKSGAVQFSDNYELEFHAPPKSTIDDQMALSPASDQERIRTVLEQARYGEAPSPIEMRIAPDGGEYVWCVLSLNCAETSNGEPATMFGRIKNIDEEKREREELVHESQTDALCGTYNKITTERKVQAALDEAGAGERYALCMIDIDDFKGINDTAGHIAGDRALVSLADSLKTVAGQAGIVGRVGGDEFVLLRSCGESSADPMTLGQKIIEGLPKTYQADERAVSLYSSVGIACYPEDGHSFYDLFKHADAALYLAKERGKNQVCLYRE
ncbi:EAL domain-containing protein [Gordonibacter sp.]|uniref:EAL domain-containing protein n=1 Tax=Gordonibacter sp. TaxID=1968902 RepID=UPI002FC610D7